MNFYSISTSKFIYYHVIYMKYLDIGQKIREYRQKKKLTQQELADSIGVTWEMISRYERGDSSPFNRIEGLAKALKVSPLELLQNHYKASGTRVIDNMINNIPLFISKPKNLDFTTANTTYFYNAPIWITQRDKDAFAIEGSAVKNKTLRISDEAVLYISPNSSPNSKSVVLFKQGTDLLCDLFPKIVGDVVGVVLAQEVRL